MVIITLPHAQEDFLSLQKYMLDKVVRGGLAQGRGCG